MIDFREEATRILSEMEDYRAGGSLFERNILAYELAKVYELGKKDGRDEIIMQDKCRSCGFYHPNGTCMDS